MVETTRFHLPSNEGLYVDLKNRWSWGDTKAMEAARTAANSPEAGAVAFAQILLERVIVAWNLKDGNGNALAISTENLDEYLDADDAQKIIEKAVSLRGIVVAGISDPNSSTV